VRYLAETLAERADEVLGTSVVRTVQIVVEPAGETGNPRGAVVD
jgi:hypothetical protein